MRVYLHTFGCKANQYDTEVVRQALEGAGATPVADPADADIAVVNSCTVTHVAEAKLRGLVRRLSRLNPRVGTVVMGCAAALDDGAMRRLPGVREVVPGADPARVLKAFGLDAPAESGLRSFAGGSRAWLKIQDGCDEHCTFCATTLARGVNRSRPMDELVDEARTLAARHEEIVLTGIHIGTYGRDLSPDMTLGGLVERLVHQVDRVRFRLSSVEATEVDHRLADLMVAEPTRLAPHLHAPLQSGSDRLLKRMGRHWYSAGSYRRRIEELAARLPVFGLGGDIIVGFPGETEADHRATCDVVAALPFTYLHVFPYSERPGAAAARLGSPVEPAAVRARNGELRAIVADSGARYRARRAGQLADIVVLGRGRARYEGVTEDYLTVYLPSQTALPDRLAGRLHSRGETLYADAA